MGSRQMALLIDVTRCVGCRACMEACMDTHGYEGDPFEVQDLSARANTVVLERGDLFVRKQCMHCLTPSCASVCPVEALRKEDCGPVVYESSRCIGCRYCMQACPFSVPRYEWDRSVPSVVKCDLCADRVRKGEIPACAEACPAEATVAGFRDDLIQEAHRRIEESPDVYVPHVFGEREVGGTSVLFLSPVDFAALGFNTNLGEIPPARFTQAALARIPTILNVGAPVLLGIWWITRRREEVARAEAKPKTVPLRREAAEG